MPKTETEEVLVSKTMQMPAELAEAVQELVERIDSTFSAFTRQALREKLARIKEQIAQAGVAK